MQISMTQAITGTRAAIGLSCWTAPVAVSRLFGVDISNDRSGKFYIKLGGTRDLALATGCGTIGGDQKVKMLRIAAACDLADMAATVITYREGDVTKVGLCLWLLGEVACLGLTVGAMRES
jgi:hypothetical protein